MPESTNAGADFTPLTNSWLLDVVDANLQEQEYLRKEREQEEEELAKISAKKDSFRNI